MACVVLNAWTSVVLNWPICAVVSTETWAEVRVETCVVERLPIEVVLTTSSGDSGGSFEMTAEQARLLVNGNVAVADYFIRNVIL